MTATGFDPWPFTVAHFIVMGVFAVLVIAGILWGMKLKRARRQAQEEFNAHRDAADVPAVDEKDAADIEPAAIAAAPPAPPAPDAYTPDAPAPVAPPLAEIQPTQTQTQKQIQTPIGNAPLAGDITQLKGLGPKLAATLADLGITRIDQIAAMGPAELDALDARLGAFRGRPARDRWAEQARLLSSGDRAGYEAAFGKLGG